MLATAALGFSQVGSMSAAPNSIRAASPSVYQSSQQQAGPGTVNYTEGQVSVDGQPVAPHASGNLLQPGQVLDTASNGYAEVLLTPGAFLRVGNNSEVKIINAGLVNTSVQLTRGEAMVEVDQLIKNSNLTVNVANATVQPEKKGLYDINADQNAVRVLDGKANVVENATVKSVGKDDEVLLNGEPLKKADFDTKMVKSEPLYTWSEARSQYESQANLSAANYVIANGGWYGPGWYWDPYWSFYAFVPGSGFLYSPFGWGFYSPRFIYAYGPYFAYRTPYTARGFRAPGVYARASAFRASAAPSIHVMGGFHGGRR
jgi:hypothetical protein